jgi:hypothetical protein
MARYVEQLSRGPSVAQSMRFSICALSFFAVGMGWGLQAQNVPTPKDGTAPTLHVYTNTIQIPALVLGPNREPIAKPIDGNRFSISVDSGPWFRATHVRLEGDDPISLAILLDMRWGEGDFEPKIGDAIANLAPSLLHAKDHVSVYALGCDLTRSLNDAPADATQLKLGVKRALEFWTEQKNITCLKQDHLWDALAFIAGQLYQLPGRRVILALSAGRDSGSKHTWNETRSYLQDTAVAVFGMSHSFPFSTDIHRPAEDFFNLVCELSGGLVYRTQIQTLTSMMETFVTTVRGRYIIEFPRPKNATPGPHGMRVKIANGDTDFIRAAGISVPLPDPAVLADPATVSAGPEDAPEIGTRKILVKPQ